MKTIKTNIFLFEELNEVAQQKAIATEVQNLYESDTLLDGFKDYCTERADAIGFENAKFQYSLSNAQGDGLSFSAYINKIQMFSDFMPNAKTSVSDAIYNNVEAKCKGNSGHYTFARGTDVEITFEESCRSTDFSNLIELTEKFQEFVRDRYMDLCADLEKIGYEQIETGTSDKAAKENLIASGAHFTEDGEFFGYPD